MGKFKDKLKGRRQSKNVEFVEGDKIASMIEKVEKKIKDKKFQEAKGKNSMHLKDKTPLKDQENDLFTDLMNEVNNSPEKMTQRGLRLMKLQDSAKPQRLTDSVYPKEINARRKTK